MPISMHQASSPRFVKMLNNLSAILDKAQAHAEAKKLDPAVLGAQRLIVDMFPLARQVQIACDTAKGAVARLAGVEIPKHEDTEQTLPELKARIAKTLDFVQSVAAAKIDGSEEREVVMKMRGQADAFPATLRYVLVLVFSFSAGVIPASVFSGLPLHARTPQHIGTGNGIVMQASQIGQFLGPLALAWIATHLGGWHASLWALLAFAAGAALCGVAIGAIENKIRS